MASDPAPTPLPAEASPGPRSFTDLLVGLYIEPVVTFRALAARPRWALPFAGLIALNLAFTFVWMRQVDPVELSRSQMEEAGVFDRIPVDQHAAVVERQARLFPIFAWLGPVLFGPLAFLAMAALFLFVYRFFYSSETTFAQSLGVVSWALLAVGLVSTPVTLLIMGLQGEWNVDPRTVVQASPAALLDRDEVPKPLFALLDSFDLFSIWIVFLLSAGFAATAGRTVGQAAWGVLVLWGLYILGKVGLAVVF